MSKDYQSAYHKEWYKKNREKRLAQVSALYKRDKVRIRKRQTEWDKAHRESKRASWLNWFSKKRANGGNLTPKEWKSLKEKYGYRCAYCHEKVKELTQDHVIPISRGGKHDKSNVVPACRSCNAHKHTKTPAEWHHG